MPLILDMLPGHRDVQASLAKKRQAKILGAVIKEAALEIDIVTVMSAETLLSGL